MESREFSENKFSWSIQGLFLSKTGHTRTIFDKAWCGKKWRLVILRVGGEICFRVHRLGCRDSHSHRCVISFELSIEKERLRDSEGYFPSQVQKVLQFREEIQSLIRQCMKYTFPWQQLRREDYLVITSVSRCLDCPAAVGKFLPITNGQKTGEKNKAKGMKRKSAADEEAGLNKKLYHPSGTGKLARDLEHMLMSKRATDATVIVNGHKFKIHKAVLIARSTSWKREWNENGSSTLTVEDCDSVVFERFLNYIYTGNLDIVSADTVFALYELAVKHEADDLKARCVQFMADNLSVELLCDTWALSMKHDEPKLQEEAVEFFAKHALDILVTPKWLQFLKENPVASNEIHIRAASRLD